MAAQNWYHDPSNSTGYASDSNSGSGYAAPVTFATGVTAGTTSFVDATNSPFTAGMVGSYVNILTKAQYKIVTFTDSSHVVLSGSPSAGSSLTYFIGGPKLSLAQFTAANGVAAGDNINLAKSPDTAPIKDTAGNALNATFTNKSHSISVVATSGSVTLDISTAVSGWTAGTNVTAATNASSKYGATCVQLTTNASFTTAANMGYVATGTLDLSPYTKCCFWIRSNFATASGVLTVDLCSDVAGATPVHTITVPALTANDWLCVTFNNGGALSSSIKSVAIYSTATYASHVVLINNIFATNRLTLTAAITKDSSATTMTDGAYPIQSVTNSAGTSTVTLDQGANFSASTTARGYSGATATVAAYVRECNTITVAQTPGIAGTAASPINLSGGWNFSTGSQDGFTLLGLGDISLNSLVVNQAYWNLSSLGNLRGNAGISATQQGCAITGTVCSIGTNGIGFNASGTTQCLVITGSLFCIANGTSGLQIAGGNAGLINTGTLVCNSNGNNTGYNMTSASGVLWSSAGSITCNNNSAHGIATNPNNSGYVMAQINCAVVAKDNGTDGIFSTGSMFIATLTTTGNGSQSIGTLLGGQLTIGNFIPSEATVVSITHDYTGSIVQCQKYNSVAGDYRMWTEYGNILTSSGTVHGSAPLSINLQPNANANAQTPLFFDLQPAAIDTSATTFAGFMQHDNAAVVGTLTWPGGIVPGIPNDVVSTDSGGTGAWTAVSVTGTATDNYNAIRPRLTAHAAGGTGHNAYFSEQ